MSLETFLGEVKSGLVQCATGTVSRNRIVSSVRQLTMDDEPEALLAEAFNQDAVDGDWDTALDELKTLLLANRAAAEPASATLTVQRLGRIAAAVNAATDAIFRAATRNRLLGAITDVARRVGERFGLIEVDVATRTARDFLESYAGERIANINATTREDLSRTLWEGFRRKETDEQLVARVREVFRDASAGRAKTIAMTEVHRATSFGALHGMIAAGVAAKRWNCVTGDTRLQGFGISGISRRWHVGDLVTLRTASIAVRVTPEHPVLTDRGWLAAEMVEEGDQLAAYVPEIEHLAWLVPDVDDVPATVAEVFAALCEAGSPMRRMRRVVDLDGARADGEIEIVDIDGELLTHLEPALSEGRRKHLLETTDADLEILLAERYGSFGFGGSGRGGSHREPTDDGGAFGGAQPVDAGGACLALRPGAGTGRRDHSGDNLSRSSEVTGQGKRRLAGGIAFRDLSGDGVQIPAAHRGAVDAMVLQHRGRGAGALHGIHHPETRPLDGGSVADSGAVGFQELHDRRGRACETLSQRGSSLAGDVSLRDLCHGSTEIGPPPLGRSRMGTLRLSAPADAETREPNDLLNGLGGSAEGSGQRRGAFSGLVSFRYETCLGTEVIASDGCHVYDISTANGWLVANGSLVIHNSMRDDKVREQHQQMDGQVVPVLEPFTAPDGTQGLYPGDSSFSAENSINCRCVLTAAEAPTNLKAAARDEEFVKRRAIHERRMLAGVRQAFREQQAAAIAALKG